MVVMPDIPGGSLRRNRRLRMISIRLTLFVILACPAMAWAADEVTERAVEIQELTVRPTPSRSAVAGPTLEQTVVLLQQQVQSLQAQMATLQSVLQIAPNGPVTLLSPASVTIQAGTTIAVGASQNLSMRGSGTTTIEGVGTLD
jgi:hypothetical protein